MAIRWGWTQSSFAMKSNTASGKPTKHSELARPSVAVPLSPIIQLEIWPREKVGAHGRCATSGTKLRRASQGRFPAEVILKQKLEKILSKGIVQGKPHDYVTEKTVQNRQKEISEVSLTRSPSRFLGVLRLLPRLRNTRFHR